MNALLARWTSRLNNEQGHAYAWGGGGGLLLLAVLIILLIILL